MRAYSITVSLLLLVAGLPATAQDDMVWRKVEPANLVFMETSEGEVIMELNPRFAPKTVARFKDLIEQDFYRALSFYRVIEGFVAQAGDESDLTQDSEWPGLPPEFEMAFDEEMPWTRVQRDDLFAPETGFVEGFAAAREDDQVWLTHCPGAVAMARGNEPDTGSTDFYIVIGQAPRYLDRNLTIFARVIDGMDVVQRLHRGLVKDGGVINDDLARSRIRSVRLATSMEEEEGAFYYVMDTNSKGFRKMMDERRNRRHEFFHHKPPKVLDVCQVPVASRRERAPVAANEAEDTL
jgi:peptidylprolyl isomerase